MVRYIVIKTTIPEVVMPTDAFLAKDDIIHTDHGTFKVTQVEHYLIGDRNTLIKTNYICEV